MSIAPVTNSRQPAATGDFLPLQGTDYVEFYVGNAKQAAHFYKTAFGFQSVAYSGPETGDKEKVSYVIRQNKLTFVFTTALHPDHPIAAGDPGNHWISPVSMVEPGPMVIKTP